MAYEAKAVWKGKRSLEGSGFTGFTLPMDTSAEFGGDDSGFRPMELILIGLAGCTAMDVISILEKKRQDLTGLEVRVQGERAEDHPRVYTTVKIEYVVTGRNIDRTSVERAVALSEEKYCSVGAMIGKTARIESTITILEAETQL